MRRFRLISLCLSSVLALLFAGCSPVAGYRFVNATAINRTVVAPVINAHGLASLYKAKIKVFNRRYSGLMLLKQTDSATAHITFVSEIGMKIFDYELKDSSFKLTYIFAPLNKPNILKLLENDMKLMVLYNLYHRPVLSYTNGVATTLAVKNKGTTDYYAISPPQTFVKSITRKGSVFTKEKIQYYYSDSLTASGILLKHKGLIRVKMDFKLLNTNPTKPLNDGD